MTRPNPTKEPVFLSTLLFVIAAAAGEPIRSRTWGFRSQSPCLVLWRLWLVPPHAGCIHHEVPAPNVGVVKAAYMAVVGFSKDTPLKDAWRSNFWHRLRLYAVRRSPTRVPADACEEACTTVAGPVRAPRPTRRLSGGPFSDAKHRAKLFTNLSAAALQGLTGRLP